MKFSEIKKLEVGEYPAVYDGYNVTLNVRVKDTGYGDVFYVIRMDVNPSNSVFVCDKSRGEHLVLWTMPFYEAMFCKVHHSKLSLK
jgi:hypothetical protein